MGSNVFDQFDTGASPSASPAPPAIPVPDDSNPIASTPLTYEQFEAAKNNPGPVSAPQVMNGPNPFDQFDDPAHPDNQVAATSRQPSLGTLVESPFVGFNEDAADMIGAPVDFANWGMKKLGLPSSATPFMGSNFLKQSLGLIGANPDLHPALTPAERVLRGAGEGAASVMLPEAAVGAVGDKLAAVAPKMADFLENIFGSAKSLPGALTNAGVGAASGFGSAAAGELPVPDSWKPLAEMGGGLLGGGIGALSAQVPTLARQGFDAAGKFVAPMTNPRAVAGARLAEAASGKDALLNALQDNPGVVVPGSVPTLAEQTQIPGISALQHQIETKNGVPFQERRAAQNQARVGALTGIQSSGSPEDVASFLRTQLADLDQQAEGSVAARTAAAQTATSDLGGLQSPEFYGAQITGQVQPQIDAATATARGANQGLGDYVTPEQSGAQLRGAAQSADEATNQQIDALYKAVDPHGTLNTVVAPLRKQTAEIAGTVNHAAGDEMTPDEARLFQAATSFPDVIPFNTLRAFDRNVTAAMSEERAARGKTGAYARLVQLKNATQDAIENGVANQIAYERQAVARGEIAPEDTTEARIRDWEQGILAGRNEFYSNRAANLDLAQNASGNAGSGPTAVSGVPGAKSQGRNGLSNASGDQGIPQGSLVPNFDQAAADRLEAAKQAYAAYAQSKDGLIKNILKDNGFKGQYRLLDAGVPSQIFVPGAKGYETAMKYRKFVGDDPAAISALRNYAAMSARRAAERPDGTLDPQKFGAWRVAHGDALRAVPEIRPQFSRIDQAAKELEKFTPFRPDLAPSAIPEMFFHSGPSGAAGVRQLRQLLGDQHANAILTDYAASRLKQAAMRNDGTLDPAKTATWLKQHTDALREMPELVDRFSNVAKATQAIGDAAAARKAATDAYQQGAVKQLLNLSEPEPADVTRIIGRIFNKPNAVGEMRRLAQEASKSPDAREGLRKAIVDFMYGNYVGNADALKSDAFQTFIRQNRPALSTVFKPEEIDNMSTIAADLARTRKAFEQARIPGQSTTAPDLLAAKSASHEHDTLLDKLWKGVVTGGEAGEHGAVLGALAAIGSHVVGAMRMAGLKTSGDLLKEAILNKTGDGALAKALLMKMPIKPNLGSAVTLAHQLRRIAVLGAGQAASH